MEFEVTKKYHQSKKSVYGIDNELHLVEQIQKSLELMISKEQMASGGKLFLFGEEEIAMRKKDKTLSGGSTSRRQFINRQESQVGIEEHESQLNEHMQVTLKIAYNLRDLTRKQDVRKFFFARFKR